MLKLPKARYEVPAARRELVQFLGLNWSDRRREGEFSACENLSDRRYPYLCPRKPRGKVEYTNPQALFAWNGKQVLVDGTTLLYDGEAVGTVTAGEKQFAVVNTKLVIWPDKVYLDLDSLEFGKLDLAVEAVGEVTYTGDSISLAGSFGSGTAEYQGHHQSGGEGGATRHVIMRYTSVKWTEDGGWVLTGGKEVNVQTGGAGAPLSSNLTVGDIVMLKATSISGNYQLNTRTYELDYNGDEASIEEYGAYAENHKQGYYAKITGTSFENVAGFDSVHVFKQVVSFEVFNAGNNNGLMTDLFAAGETVTISGSDFPFINKEKVMVKEVGETTLTFAEGSFLVPDAYAKITADTEAGADGFAMYAGYYYNSSFDTDDSYYLAFTNPGRLLAGQVVLRFGSGTNGKLYLYEDPTKEPVLLETTLLEGYNQLGSRVSLSYKTYDGIETGTVTVKRDIPDLDFICESENRLWGVCSEDRTIYASALGAPKVFFDYSGLSTDSYAVAVGSEGDFTGICKYGSAVLCWKERTLHKILGSYPAEYQMVSYQYAGVREGCHKSLVNLNEVLFYLGCGGVYAYSGGAPALISAEFGSRILSDGVAGTDGRRYWLSAKEQDGGWHLLAYDTQNHFWLREDNTQAMDFCRIGDEVRYLAGNTVYTMGAGAEAVEWSATLAPFWETVQGRKRLSRLFARVEVPKGSWLKAEVRCDGGKWTQAGTVVGESNDTEVLVIAPNRCDKFEIRLSGKGESAVLSLLREFKVGSER